LIASDARCATLLDISEMLRVRDIALITDGPHPHAAAVGGMPYSVLGAVAQFEREVLREGTVAGTRSALFDKREVRVSVASDL